MHLHPMPFEQIRTGTKRVEVRLNEEKRQKIRVGDSLTFILRTDASLSISAQVTQIFHAPSFLEIFRITNKKETAEMLAQNADAMYQYYLPEDEKKYGVVGICFEA